MKAVRSAEPFIPLQPSLDNLWDAAQQCRGCDLYLHATQAVVGEGPQHAPMMLIGEQPGDQEDRSGRPFIGPAGRLLDRALAEAQIDRQNVYITNAVKHFKYEERGKRRIHKKPGAVEINACRPWLDTEVSLLKPVVIVCLGATAAQTLLGKTFRLTKDRGVFSEHPSAAILATIHPSALLRVIDPGSRDAEYARFVMDLQTARERLETTRRANSSTR